MLYFIIFIFVCLFVFLFVCMFALLSFLLKFFQSIIVVRIGENQSDVCFCNIVLFDNRIPNNVPRSFI